MSDNVPAPAPQPVIELIGAEVVSRLAPDTVTLTGVTWQVLPGEFWVIGGLGGSGKTDLLCTLAGLARPARGILRLFGDEVTPGYDYDRLRDRLRVALVFGEQGRLLRHLTARQNIALPLEYHRPQDPGNTARIESLLEFTETRPWADELPSSLSPAWARRVGLARALALKPPVLLLDNPLAGLDPRHAAWWLDRLDELWRGHPVLDGQAATIVVAATDFRPWRRAGRRLAVIQNTHLVPLPGAGAALEDPAAEALAALLSWTHRST